MNRLTTDRYTETMYHSISWYQNTTRPWWLNMCIKFDILALWHVVLFLSCSVPWKVWPWLMTLKNNRPLRLITGKTCVLNLMILVLIYLTDKVLTGGQIRTALYQKYNPCDKRTVTSTRSGSYKWRKNYNQTSSERVVQSDIFWASWIHPVVCCSEKPGVAWGFY